MNLHHAILWQPGMAGRVGFFCLGLLIPLLVAAIRLVTGVAYEFHIFFTLPVLLAIAWLFAQLRTTLKREARLASEDALTGLPNRREFHEQGKRALAHSCSLGDDEFALILPGMGCESAARYVEDLRQRLLALMRQINWPVAFSIGAASYSRPPERLDIVLAKADALMYEVKNGGRDNLLFRECN